MASPYDAPEFYSTEAASSARPEPEMFFTRIEGYIVPALYFQMVFCLLNVVVGATVPQKHYDAWKNLIFFVLIPVFGGYGLWVSWNWGHSNLLGPVDRQQFASGDAQMAASREAASFVPTHARGGDLGQVEWTEFQRDWYARHAQEHMKPSSAPDAGEREFVAYLAANPWAKQQIHEPPGPSVGGLADVFGR